MVIQNYDNETLAEKRLEQIKLERLNEKAVGSVEEIIPFAWRYPVVSMRKKPHKAIRKMFK